MAQNFAATYLLAYLETIACHKQMSDVSEIMLNRIERRDWLEWNLLPPKPITLRALKQLQIRVLQDHICYNTMHGNNKATSFNHGSSNGICRNLGFGPNMIAVITRRMMRMWTQMMSSTFCPGVNPSHIMHAMRRFDNFAPGWFPWSKTQSCGKASIFLLIKGCDNKIWLKERHIVLSQSSYIKQYIQPVLLCQIRPLCSVKNT